MRNRTQVRGALLAGARELRVVGRLGVGLDNIDVAACEARGIEVIPATGANALAVAEYVIGTAMLLLRGAYSRPRAVAAGTLAAHRALARAARSPARRSASSASAASAGSPRG